MGCQRHSVDTGSSTPVYAVPCPDGYVLLGYDNNGLPEVGTKHPWTTMYFLGYMPAQQAFNPNAPVAFQDHLCNGLPQN